ncbi:MULTISPECIES: hypothetical protein [Catenuloplanes]|uniref:Uncharacterized protein n=1 Tax=Catenuloplanes niger TaxID=587534 RepID=A0AAE4CSS9_9ACTN|nr:hypothetical protein [Catenuloplanes niger]MDR7323350.1 hypothetical protein [Catenuloplanes niger]
MHEHTARLVRRLEEGARELTRAASNHAGREAQLRRDAAAGAEAAAKRLRADYARDLPYEAHERYDLLATAAECGGWVGDGHPSHRDQMTRPAVLARLASDGLLVKVDGAALNRYFLARPR